MTDQHRATPEQWEYQERWASDDDDASCILELRCRVEALEADQLEQAESNRFCTDAIVRRVEALEAFDHRPLLAAVRAQSKAVAHFGNRLDALEAAQQDNLDRLMANLDRLIALDDDDPTPDDVIMDEGEQFHAVTARANGWRPLEVETTYGSEPAADAAQILRAPITVEGTFEHGGETYRFKAKPERDAAMTELRAASAEVRPAGLVERVAMAANCYPHENASAAIREVAKWLREQGTPASGWAMRLEQEADRG